MDYSLVFAFTQDRSKVLLIEKQRPTWQKNRLNGIGGKLDLNRDIPSIFDLKATKQTPMRNCARREFFEETGIVLKEGDIIPKAQMLGRVEGKNEGWHVHVYAAFTDLVEDAVTKTDEKVRLVNTQEVLKCLIHPGYQKYYMENVPWLIGLCLDMAPPYMVKAYY